MLASHDRRRTSVGGFLDVAAQSGIDIVPLPLVTPGLGRAVTPEAQAWVNQQLHKALQTIGYIDGVFLQLHGGGTVDGDDGPDEALMATLRDSLGEQAALMAILRMVTPVV